MEKFRLLTVALAGSLLAGCGGSTIQSSLLSASDSSDSATPAKLSDQGLYSDIANKTIADGVTGFTPLYPLWVDGADKDRFIILPDGGEVDKSDPDHWKFPVGTKLFKEFGVDGKRLETRMVYKRSEGEFIITAFEWNDNESEAIQMPNGDKNVRGTDHDIPSETACLACHRGEADRVLGYSAIQLGETAVPGNETAKAALGYLHGNCGHCHNPMGFAADETSLTMRLNVADQAVEDTTTYKSAVDVDLDMFSHEGITKRIAKRDAAHSAIVYRMSVRDQDQMPPIGTKKVDGTAVQAVSAWINSLN